MPFYKHLNASELPNAVLLDLWQRTVKAHENLCEVWISAICEAHGPVLAQQIAVAAWPQRGEGASWKSLFFDDLRFVIAASKLKPDLLTVASDINANLPRELEQLGGVFMLLVNASRLLNTAAKPTAQTPINKLRQKLKGQGITLGFRLLRALWRSTESKKSFACNWDTVETRILHGANGEQLALLWNYAALAYMFATDSMYNGLASRLGVEAAQAVEKTVWLNKGAAEYDLDIGLQALKVKGNDVEALLRGFQFAPGEVGILNVDFNLINKNHGILTHKTCPAVDRFEHYDESRLAHCCEICKIGMPISGYMVNKKIECNALKLPPRLHQGDIACQWEYILREPSASA